MQADEKDMHACQRDGCGCTVPADKQFCSEHCMHAVSSGTAHSEEPHSCECGHKECAESL